MVTFTLDSHMSQGEVNVHNCPPEGQCQGASAPPVHTWGGLGCHWGWGWEPNPRRVVSQDPGLGLGRH